MRTQNLLIHGGALFALGLVLAPAVGQTPTSPPPPPMQPKPVPPQTQPKPIPPKTPPDQLRPPPTAPMNPTNPMTPVSPTDPDAIRPPPRPISPLPNVNDPKNKPEPKPREPDGDDDKKKPDNKKPQPPRFIRPSLPPANPYSNRNYTPNPYSPDGRSGERGGQNNRTRSGSSKYEPGSEDERNPLQRALMAAGLPNEEGKIAWPLALRILPGADPLVAQVDAQFSTLANQALAGGINPQLPEEVHATVSRLRELLQRDRQQKFSLTESMYTIGDRFIGRLHEAVNTIQAIEAPNGQNQYLPSAGRAKASKY